MIENTNTTNNTVTETANTQEKGNVNMQETIEQTQTATTENATVVPAKKAKKGRESVLEQLLTPNSTFSPIQLSKWFDSPTTDEAVKAHIIARNDCPVEIFESAVNMRTLKQEKPDAEWVERKSHLFQVMASCGGKAQTDFLLKIGAVKGLNTTGEALLVSYGNAKTVIEIVSNPNFDLEQLPKLFDNKAWCGEESGELAVKVSEAIQNVITNDIVKIGKVYSLICSQVIAERAKQNPVIKNLLRGLLDVADSVNAQLRADLLGDEQ